MIIYSRNCIGGGREEGKEESKGDTSLTRSAVFVHASKLQIYQLMKDLPS